MVVLACTGKVQGSSPVRSICLLGPLRTEKLRLAGKARDCAIALGVNPQNNYMRQNSFPLLCFKRGGGVVFAVFRDPDFLLFGQEVGVDVALDPFEENI